MGNYVIRVDSSTKPAIEFVGYGKSSAAWTIHMGSHMIGAGVIYYSSNGPNKSVYVGILAALSQLESKYFYRGGTDTVEILIDCQPVLNQLNGAHAEKMRKHKARVTRFVDAHPNVTFAYAYQNETV